MLLCDGYRHVGFNPKSMKSFGIQQRVFVFEVFAFLRHFFDPLSSPRFTMSGWRQGCRPDHYGSKESNVAVDRTAMADTIRRRVRLLVFSSRDQVVSHLLGDQNLSKWPTRLKHIGQSRYRRTTRYKTSIPSLNAHMPLEAFC